MASQCQKVLTRRKVCLFGTSANPPTGVGGHVGIVQAVAAMNAFDEIRVLPVYQHTFQSKRNQLLSYERRIEMSELAFGDIPKVVVSRAEEESWNYHTKDITSSETLKSMRVGTADLLEMLQSQEPHTEFSFCLGADTFLDLTSWKWRRSKDVLRLLNGRIVVFVRPDASENSSTDKPPSTLSTSNKLALQARIEQVYDQMSFNGSPISLLEVPSLQAISSSMVRSTCDPKAVSHLVASKVLAFMMQNKLYGFESSENSS